MKPNSETHTRALPPHPPAVQACTLGLGVCVCECETPEAHNCGAPGPWEFSKGGARNVVAPTPFQNLDKGNILASVRAREFERKWRNRLIVNQRVYAFW
jgi:hypothetical protein